VQLPLSRLDARLRRHRHTIRAGNQAADLCPYH
jgi:hypothetical protein